LKLINTLSLIIIAAIVAFFSLFWIGSYEQKMELHRQLPFSFVFRFLGLSAIGFIGVGFLLVFNYLIEKLILKEVYVPGLKKLAIDGVVAVGTVALIGTILFFL
jgi:hypothetical protein